MIRSRLIPAATAAILVLGATEAAFAGSGEHENGKEIAAVRSAKTSIVEAIAAAEQKTGGRAVKIDVGGENGRYFYEVKTVTKDKVSEASVDLMSGQVTQAHDEGLLARIFDREDHDELAKLADSPTTLAAAIAVAEQNLGGKAIEASFDNENGAFRFQVKVAKDNAVRRVVIDSATGSVTRVAVGQDDEDED